MTLTLTNLIHETNQIAQEITHQAACARQWMLRNYWQHLTADGRIDAEALAEQAVLECDIDRLTADDIAALVAAEVDN